MGVATALVALHMGASQVVMCGDPRGVDAIKLARQIGAEVRGAPVESNSDESFDVVVVVTEAPVEYVAAAVAMAAPLGRVILACTSTSPSGIVPEAVRRKGLTLKGGRGASAPSLARAVDIVVLERERMLNSDGELHTFEEAEGILSGLLDKGVARGAHVVITDRIDEGRDSDA
ncbi:hypothetical protein AWV79_26760 [Cupriavidus sp. UYMMa02A]|nr:hypothetical protein AWV79_26760 [Cupriavidus sp. UYMMa02A]